MEKTIHLIKNTESRLLSYISVYLILSVLVYLFGPLSYPKVNIEQTTFFILLYYVSFLFGYVVSSRYFRVGKRINLKFNEVSFFNLIGILSILFSVLTIKLLIKGDFFSTLMLSLSSPGELYEQNLKTEKTSNIVTQLNTLLSPFIYCCVPFGVILWPKLKFSSKIILIIAMSLQIVSYMLKGTNFGIFLVLFPIAIVKYLLKSECGNGSVNRTGKRIAVLFSCLFLFYFVYNLSTRLGIDYVPNTLFGIPINKNNILFSIFPPSVGFAITAASSYISQGYYGFSLAFDYNYTSTMGFGSGRFIIDKLAWIYDANIWSLTYQAKMDAVWDPAIQWHTAYLWLANDVGFWGVAIVMCIFGWLFSLVLRDAVLNRNSVSMILLSLYLLIIIFIPANSIVSGNPTVFMSFVALNCLFFLFNRVLVSK